MKVMGDYGNDILIIEDVGDGKLRLSFSHGCIWHANAVVPVEFLTALLADSIKHNNDIPEQIENSDWPAAFKDKLQKKFHPLDGR